MSIDQISQKILLLAIYLDSKAPSSISEIWLEPSILDWLRDLQITEENLAKTIVETKEELRKLDDKRRKIYLNEILQSLDFQLNNCNTIVPYEVFSQQTFGFTIKQVTDEEIDLLIDKITDLEKKVGLSFQEVLAKSQVKPQNYERLFLTAVANSKKQLPKYITNFDDQGFSFTTTTNQPWAAFNSHLRPGHSKLELNSDTHFTEYSLKRLAYHEGYGGHHSELCHKDKLLLQGRGEHGFVLTFSPQTFISEAIAEFVYVFLGGMDQKDDIEILVWSIDRLTFALYNKTAFWFLEDKFTLDQIRDRLTIYPISMRTIEDIINFSTDPIFGKYAPVYYSAFNFLSDLYTHTNLKNQLIKELFTLPCTPQILLNSYLRK